MCKHSPYLLILIGSLVLIFGTASQTLGAQRGYLQTYKKDNFRDLTKVRFLNVVAPRSAADYVVWPESEQDPVLSIRYRAPVGWWVCLYNEDNGNSQKKCWPGTGKEESLTKESIPEFLQKKVSGHLWHR
ncbi:MAG: hypothetical protein ACQ9MH_09705 [Nitrospinales bacterium]